MLRSNGGRSGLKTKCRRVWREGTPWRELWGGGREKFCSKWKYLSMFKCCQEVSSAEQEAEATREGTVYDKVTEEAKRMKYKLCSPERLALDELL